MRRRPISDLQKDLTYTVGEISYSQKLEVIPRSYGGIKKSFQPWGWSFM